MTDKARKHAVNKRPSASQKGGLKIGRRLRKSVKLSHIFLSLIILLGLQTFLAGTTYSNQLIKIDGKAKDETKALILSAHPDDEVMFFAPAILNLRKQDVKVFGLCLSNGNGDGLGQIRSKELLESYSVLGIPSNQTMLIDDIQLQDGMRTVWNSERILHHIEQFSNQVGKFDVLFTFDEGGVSGHTNHKACASTAALVLQSSNAFTENAKVYTLKTYVLPIKFLGLPGALLRQTLARFTGQLTFLSNPLEYLQSLKAMSQHESQLVWFRYLYVLFSSYMYGGQFDLLVNG